ncbi:MAG: iron-sulfur cluster assembly scaffold protein [Candidatus Hodarchaeales archaeon]|jgi:nitrogen fixation NifU-like protein
MGMYTKEVMDLFLKPENMGEIEDASAIGKVGNPTCGDIMWVYLKIDDQDIIQDVKVKTFGCVAAIATSSKTTQIIKGMNINDAYKVTKKQVAEELGGLPKTKMHCSNLAVDAVQRAIQNYFKKNNRSLNDLES